MPDNPNNSNTSKDSEYDNRVETGIKVFDNRSNYGGLPVGKPIAYQYDLIYQGDVLLYSLANNQNTKFVTTTKSPERVKELVYYSSSKYVEERNYHENLEIFDGLNQKGKKAAKQAANAVEEGDLLIIDRYQDVVQDMKRPAEAVEFTEQIIEKTKKTNSLCFLSFNNGENLSELEEIIIGQLPGLMEMKYTDVGGKLKQVLRTHRIRGFNTGKKTLADINTTHEVSVESGELRENADTTRG